MPVVYPPYYPPDIQARRLDEGNELMMSDVPWAVAWYGHHQCVWLTLNCQDEFFAINDYMKPVQALYLPRKRWTADLFPIGCAAANTVGAISLSSRGAKSNSVNFPWTTRPRFFPERLFLTDRIAGNCRNKFRRAVRNSRRRAPQPVGDARPFRQFRRRLHHDQFRACLVAAVQLRVNRPRKRLRVVRNDTHPRKIFRPTEFACGR